MFRHELEELCVLAEAHATLLREAAAPVRRGDVMRLLHCSTHYVTKLMRSGVLPYQTKPSGQVVFEACELKKLKEKLLCCVRCGRPKELHLGRETYFKPYCQKGFPGTYLAPLAVRVAELEQEETQYGRSMAHFAASVGGRTAAAKPIAVLQKPAHCKHGLHCLIDYGSCICLCAGCRP